MEELLDEIIKCKHCKDFLPLAPNPVIRASETAKILIVGQAPGIKVHQTGIPWNDPSGNQLRKWLNISNEVFYDTSKIAIVPMGFCYPGKSKTGDLPPREECAPLWHKKLLNQMPNIELTLLIGQFAQKYYLKEKCKKQLTQTVGSFEEYLPKYFPLPHPSPRNRFWIQKNQWYEKNIIPILQEKVSEILLK
ncbi:uracil-DNA glycosylase family protein [Flavobacterium sp. J27]|uniref:uracil-DNA glycosylase family protein n=1 Tax=Flavobacterium sp. J27 TaxID=2060419 RepID=UPI0010323070|nr:uracil-DNA glycosylase family protein [Flavobacterium sp. J27]